MMNNKETNNSIGSRWQSNGRGSGLFRRGGSSRQRQNYGFDRYSNVRRDEHVVSEFEFPKTEEALLTKSTRFHEPSEVACYSRVASGDVHSDDRSLRHIKHNLSQCVGADLNQGFETFIPKRVLECHGFGYLLDCIRNKNIPLQDTHFVTFRNNLNKILATAYIRHEPWEMGVHKRNGVVYLDVHDLPERPLSELDRRRCYWGLSFEDLATEEKGIARRESVGPVDANVEFCSVIKTKLGAHPIIIGAEMDCCDATDDGKRFYVELKTTYELDSRSQERFERQKLLKFWIQSFLAGVPYIIVGFRDDKGRLVRIEKLRTNDIPQTGKMKNYWHMEVCIGFADEVLSWLYETVEENQDCILQFAWPYKSLELLQAKSCPEVISSHVLKL